DELAKQLQDRSGPLAFAQRESCGLGTGVGRSCHEPLHDAVLQRMKADHGKSPLRRQQVQSGRERTREFLKLTIDVNPYSLKGASGRVLPLLARPDDARHEFGKLSGG